MTIYQQKNYQLLQYKCSRVYKVAYEPINLLERPELRVIPLLNYSMDVHFKATNLEQKTTKTS